MELTAFPVVMEKAATAAICCGNALKYYPFVHARKIANEERKTLGGVENKYIKKFCLVDEKKGFQLAEKSPVNLFFNLLLIQYDWLGDS